MHFETREAKIQKKKMRFRNDEATIYHIFHVRELKVRYIAYISISQSLFFFDVFINIE